MSYRPALILTGFALLFAAMLTPAVQAQDAQAFGYFGSPSGPPQQPAGTLSKMHGVMVPAKLAPLMLEKVNNQALATAADNEPHEGKPLKIGVSRNVAFDAAMGSWFDAVDGGRLWVMELSSPGAIGIRVQFTGLNLPAGAQLVAYAATDTSQIGGPYTGAGDFGTGEQYTPTLFDDRVRIEYYVPKRNDAGPLPFDIPTIQHIFRDPIKSGFGDVTPTEGSCHYDVTCYSAWANVAKAVGRYSFVESGDSYLCTGQLIAKTVPDSTPYFITARHCVSTVAVASTVDVYWLYQTASCNGSAPSLGSLAHTTGATVKATRLTSDGSLLQLTGSLPGGLYWVGWRSAAVTNGSAGACVHHPDGAYKRISWATMTDNTGYTISGETEVVRADWAALSPATNVGVTEGGSSGGGLFTNDANQQLVGTLSGGPSQCGASAVNLNDGFGRFASFYPDIAGFLGAPASDDSFEPDDACATAHAIAVVAGTPVTNNGLIVRSASEDWYSYSVPAGHTLTVGLSFTNSGGNIDETLYTTCGGAIITSSLTTNNAESVTYLNSGGSTQTVRVRVYLASGTTNTYNMTSTLTAPAPTDDGFEPDDTCATARAVAVAVGSPVTNAGLIVRSVSEDWYSYSVPAGNTLTVGLSFTNSSGNIDQTLFTTCGGSIISSSLTTNNTESVTYTNPGGSAQAVFVRVYLAGGTTNTYTMTSTLAPPATISDTCAGAIAVSSGGTYSGTTSGMTVDGGNNCDGTVRPDVWYKFTAASSVRLSVDTCTSTAPNDTVISLHSACPGTGTNQIVCSDDAGAGEGPCGSGTNTTSFVQTDLTAGQTVYIRVAMYWDIGSIHNSGTVTGAFVMHVNTSSLSVPNDVCTTAAAITGPSPIVTAFNSTNALTEGPTETACNYFGFSGIARDIWYSYAMPSHGDLVVDTCGSTFDTKLAIYDSCPTSGGTPLACDDDAAPVCDATHQYNSRVSVTGSAAGHVYYIRVGGFRTTTGVDSYGAGTLNVAFTPTQAPCIPDMGIQGGTPGSDGILDNNDFVVFINFFFNLNPIADIGIQGGTSGSDGLFDNNDFVVFIDDFFTGCP